MGQSPSATRAGGAPDLVITNVVIVDSTGIRKADVGIRDGRIAAIGKAGNPGIMDGVTRGPGDRRVDGGDGRRGAHPDRRRDRLARPLHLAEPDSRRVLFGHHHADWRRDRAGNGHESDDLHAGRLEYPPDVRGGRGVSVEFRLPRQGQLLRRRAAARADSRRRARPEAARGLGIDAGRDRSVPVGRRRVRRAGGDSHRHDQRNRLRRGHHPRDRADGPFTPTTPRAPAAATRPTSSGSAASRTCSPRPRIRRCRSRGIRWTSTSTC